MLYHCACSVTELQETLQAWVCVTISHCRVNVCLLFRTSISAKFRLRSKLGGGVVLCLRMCNLSCHVEGNPSTTQTRYPSSIQRQSRWPLMYGRTTRKIDGGICFKSCVRDRKRVFVFTLQAMQYPVIVWLGKKELQLFYHRSPSEFATL